MKPKARPTFLLRVWTVLGIIVLFLCILAGSLITLFLTQHYFYSYPVPRSPAKNTIGLQFVDGLYFFVDNQTIYTYYENGSFKSSKPVPPSTYYFQNYSKPSIEQKSQLQQILDLLILNNNESNENWTCFDYASYYNKTIIKKYPLLDVRWIRYLDVCNNLTLCMDYHTVILVGGFFEEGLLEQKRYVSIKLSENYTS